VNKFRLQKEEIAREIHHLLKESFPDKDIDGGSIGEFITNNENGKNGFTFNIRGYCEKSGLEPVTTIERLMYGLEVELEKNLHDKILFGIRLKGDEIEFYEAGQ
jgi:hypothetical protein